MTTASTITTAEQLLKAGDIGRCELVRGELKMMSPGGFQHGKVVGKLHPIIARHVEERRIGVVLGAETGFFIKRNPDTVRAPDVAFVRADRLSQAPKRGFFPAAPDLAIEVLSPDDTASEVLAKVQEWLAAGTVAVWVVDPERKTIAIHHTDQPVRVLGEGDEVDAGEPLQGLRFTAGDVFT